MSLLKFILYSLIAYLVIRFVVRVFFTPKRPQYPNQNPNTSRTYPTTESLEKPKFTIDAESVDYEIIEEPKDESKK